jgi:asparagine synthase (glutamine-hydrolysing)
MPGIIGLIGERCEAEGQRLLEAMVASMKHDAAYLSGSRCFPELGVYCGWVAHEGSFAAHQCSDDAQVARVFFSGECSPRPRLSKEPAQPDKGQRRSSGLLELYQAHGSSFVAGLNGLFSGLLVDPVRRCAFLFNDRYGSERIYCHERDGVTYFASEAKALLTILPSVRCFDEQGIVQFLTYGSTMEGRTLFRGVRLLPGGSLWTFRGTGLPSRKRYFHPREWESQLPLQEEAFVAQFEERMRETVPDYFASDGKLGISLTGGLDTRMIMACMPERGSHAVCYTFAGHSGETLDVKLARVVAKACGLEHHVLRIGKDFLVEYGRHVDRTVFVTDGCAGALGAHELSFTEQARQLSLVRLTGNYGSEVLRSMSTFKPIGLAGDVLDPGVREAIRAQHSAIAVDHAHPVTHAVFREIPWHLYGALAAGRSQLVFRTPYLHNDIVKLAYRAPPASRVSLGAALRVVQRSRYQLACIPTDRGLVASARGAGNACRRILAEATFKLDYLHKEGMPGWLAPLDPLLGSVGRLGVLGLHKFLPYRIWFRQELAAYVRDVLTDARTRQMPYWNPRWLQEMAARHTAGRANYLNEINAVLTLEAADRVLLRGTARTMGSQRVESTATQV